MEDYMEVEPRVIRNSARTTATLGTNNTLKHNEKNRFIRSFISKIFQKLNSEENNNSELKLKEEINEVYVIDRFEGNYAICENRSTKEMKNINIYELPENIKEGDVLRYINNEYILDLELRSEIEERIKNKTKNIFED
jgi:ABC-type sugar transport system ATPase subunit